MAARTLKHNNVLEKGWWKRGPDFALSFKKREELGKACRHQLTFLQEPSFFPESPKRQRQKEKSNLREGRFCQGGKETRQQYLKIREEKCLQGIFK